MQKKKIVGWREYVALPEWGIKKISAKIDTGAKSSSLHAEDIKQISDTKIRFYITLNGNKKRKKIIASPTHRGKVKSSEGARTHRWFIETILKIGKTERMTRINLTNRTEMNFPMLIGRTALENFFLVDVARENLLTQKSRRKKKSTKKGER